MKASLLIFTAFSLIAVLLIAGCTQPASPASQATTPVPAPVSESPTAPSTTVATAVTITTPVPTTIIPAAPLPGVIKDTKLLFTIDAPKGYNGTTIRATKASGNIIIYKTTIYNPSVLHIDQTVNDNTGNYVQLDDALTIFFYTTALAQDSIIRNLIRDSGVASNETSVSYNGITYTRFEMASDPFNGKSGKTVVFVGNKASASENGYIPEMIYSETGAGTLGQATLENMVQSFRWYALNRIDSAPGVETDRPSFYQ